MKTIRVSLHPSENDIARLARLMINVEEGAQIYEWEDEKDAKSQPQDAVAGDFLAISVGEQHSVAPFTVCARVEGGTLFMQWDCGSRLLTRLATELSTLNNERYRHCSSRNKVYRRGFTWSIHPLYSAPDSLSMTFNIAAGAILAHSGGAIAEAIDRGSASGLDELFPEQPLVPDRGFWFNGVRMECAIWARFRADRLTLSDKSDKFVLTVPAREVVAANGYLRGFIVAPQSGGGERLLPGVCGVFANPNKWAFVRWEHHIPTHAMLSVPDIPLWRGDEQTTAG